MQKFLKIFSVTVIVLFGLSLFGWMVFHISKGDKSFGFLEKPVTFLYTFPDLFSQSVEEVKSLPESFVATPEDFEAVNRLKSDLYVLMTYSDTGDTRSIEIRNLKDGKTAYRWNLENPLKEHNRILHPLLLPGKDLVYFFSGATGLRRIDSLGNIAWQQDTILAHHSMETDSDENIWVCTFEPIYYANGLYELNGRSVFFKDNYITKIDSETGRILFHKSVTEMLVENGISNYLLKSDDPADPLHINDIQPALENTEYYLKGDLFISARNTSFVLQYRPSTSELVRVLEGPFMSQHDVDFQGNDALLIFNNNYYTIWTHKSMQPPADSSSLVMAGDFYSNIVKYDFRNDRWSFIADSVFRANEIFTHTEGLMEQVGPDTYFVEEQNTGLLWVVNEHDVLYKNVLHSQHPGYHHLPNWTRILKDYD